MAVTVNYVKRKNTQLFKALEMAEEVDLSKIQNYVPIYNRFFSLNETNYNNVNLNHRWVIENINDSMDDDDRLFNCVIKDTNANVTKDKDVFFKMAPLLDPFKYLIGKYNINDPNLFNLPTYQSNAATVHSKILDMNNSAYVDGFFSYLTSQLIHNHHFVNGVDYYGSFLAIKNNFSLNIIDDLEYLSKSDFFNKHKNVLFEVDEYDEYDEYDDCDDRRAQPKIPIKIHTDEDINVDECIAIDENMFEDIFEPVISLAEMKDLSLNLIDVEVFNMDNSTTTLKSTSTCSSRTSYTEENGESVPVNMLGKRNDECTEHREESEEGSTKGSVEGSTKGSVDEGSDDLTDEEEIIEATLHNFPVHVICMEHCANTFDELIINDELSGDEWFASLMQVIMILITYQKAYAFTHNDLHTNNIMYVKTDKKFLYYCFNKKYYKVPTYGKIYKIIDFGRSIYRFDNKVFCSDSFQPGGDAATQYNIEPYFNEKKPRLDPNYSFDLCRLACSIFDYVIDDMRDIAHLDKCEPISRLIAEWTMDDNGINVLYKNNGAERYPDFKLYKMIARCVHKHTPQAQLERPEFSKYVINNKDIPKKDKVVNIDEIPIYTGALTP